MSNMSYCRFRNTDRDLLDCQEALRDLANLEAEPLSRDELDAAKSLVARCVAIINAVVEHSGGNLDAIEENVSVIATDCAIDAMNEDAKTTRRRDE